MSKRKAGLRSLAFALGMAAVVASAGTITYQYDNLGRLRSVQYPGGAVAVYTLDAAGNRTLVQLGDVTLPTVPGSLSATAASGTQINLSWTASTDNIGVTGYRVYRNGGTTPLTTVSSGTTYNDTGLAQHTAYSYQVSAIDAVGNESAKSNTASATTPDTSAPSQPTALTATAISPTQINLGWTASTDNVAVTGYRIYRNGGATPYTTVTATAYNDTGLANTTTYTYQVSAIDAANNESTKSTLASATTPTPPDTTKPTSPPGFTASAASSTLVNMSWGASTDNVGVTGYRVSRTTVSTGTTVPLGTTTSLSYPDTTASGSTAYVYFVEAYDLAGNYSIPSTAPQLTTPDTIAPTQPGTLSASAVSSTQVNLSWGASTDSGGSGLAGYRIYRNGGLYTSVGAGTTSYSDTGTTGTTSYSYYVVAYDNAPTPNVSAATNTVNLITPDTIAPTTPGTLSGSATYSQVNLSWGGSTDTGGSGLAGYRIYRNGSYYTSTASTSYADTGIDQNTSYTYSVAAYDNANNTSGTTNTVNVSVPVNWITITGPNLVVLPAYASTYACSAWIDTVWTGAYVQECHLVNGNYSVISYAFSPYTTPQFTSSASPGYEYTGTLGSYVMRVYSSKLGTH